VKGEAGAAAAAAEEEDMEERVTEFLRPYRAARFNTTSSRYDNKYILLGLY
jgi:hypothetical protein